MINIQKFCHAFIHFKLEDTNAQTTITALYNLMSKVQSKRPQYFLSLRKRIFRECKTRTDSDICQLLDVTLEEACNERNPTTWEAFTVPFIIIEIFDDYAQNNMDAEVYYKFKSLSIRSLTQYIQSKFGVFIRQNEFTPIIAREKLDSYYMSDNLNAIDFIIGAATVYFISKLF